MFAICNLSLVPVRKEASDRSEMISQLLFGEAVEILDKQKSWYKIKMLFDQYVGWIDQKQVVIITEEEIGSYKTKSSSISTDLLQIVFVNGGEMLSIVMGSSLPFYQNKKMTFGKTEYVFEGTSIDSSVARPENIVHHAQLFLNAPYLWGGRSPFGIDCSGLTQIVYKMCGIAMKRDASQQAEDGETIAWIQESKAGDLAFFDNEEGKIVHVGIIAHNNLIIHASGKVRVDQLDHQGIFNKETGKYSHNLRVIKRYSSI